MEKTLNEQLFEELHSARMSMHKPGMLGHEGGPHGDMPRPPMGMDGPRPPMGMEGNGPEGHRPPMPPHGFGHGPQMDRPKPLPRERILQIVLDAGEDGMRQKEIAEELRINPSSLSELINKLEADNYLERKVDPNDKRATRIYLTEKGTARAIELQDERNEVLEEQFSNLTEEEKIQLLNLLKKLNAKNEMVK